jgi:hypothetical protein
MTRQPGSDGGHAADRRRQFEAERGLTGDGELELPPERPDDDDTSDGPESDEAEPGGSGHDERESGGA